jgi:hypothetical protein
MIVLCGAMVGSLSPFASSAWAQTELDQVTEFLQANCLDCHVGEDAERGFELDQIAQSWTAGRPSDASVEAFEKAWLRIESRQMPPPDAGQPSEAEFAAAERAMDRLLDRHATEHPHAGPTEPLRRLTRTEYRNAIRDLLSMEIDVASILPPDSSSDGFDNITVGDLSPLLVDRYLTAAMRISRAAVGTNVTQPGGVTIRLPPDQTQERHVAGLPLGTRGGTVIEHHFPRSGEYEIQVRLMRDRDGRVEGFSEPHEMDVLVDRKRANRFPLKPPRGNNHANYDSELNHRMTIQAGVHQVGVTFVEKSSSLIEIKREPFDASFNRHRHPRRTPAIHEVSIIGPFATPDSDPGHEDAVSESRRALFIARPGPNLAPEEAARKVFSHFMRLAYRRRIAEADLVVPMEYFGRALAESDEQTGAGESGVKNLQQRFDSGVESGLASILVNPNFLFRATVQPADAAPGSTYSISPQELASSLSFFLWSSLPDETLLDLADSGELTDAQTLDAQTRRMLADPRSRSLVDSFADQWLYLRNLPTITPDLRKFPDFDNNLREAFAEETKHLFADVIRRDASVLTLIASDHTFLNDRLAMHYGIPGIVGSHFRRVALRPEWHRGGLLRHGSVLMATSYATRTSPTIRGAWILENILGTPPPPPPPNVPTIKEKPSAEPLSFREMLAKHRVDPGCASCHDVIDPVGFALDRYDAVGRWRSTEEGQPIDARGRLPDGIEVDGVAQLEQGILERPDLFVMALTEKLMTYALGRPIAPTDGAAIRRIVRDAAGDDYRFSDLISGITRSTPFLMRTSQ